MNPALVGLTTFGVLIALGLYAGYVRRVLFAPVPYVRTVGNLAMIGGRDPLGV